MALQSDKNLYPGINAHLNSFLQQRDGGWEAFHAEHLTAISRTLDEILPVNYYAIAEKSLQISEIGFVSESRRSRPDVTIYHQPIQDYQPTTALAATMPTAIMALRDTLEDEDDYLTGVVIYAVEEGKTPGNPVARLELLSPANKPPHTFYRQYWAKRLQTLYSGLTLVEIDYLHQSRPVLPALLSYADGDEDAFPYSVVVSDPRPEPADGKLAIYGFGVDDELPKVVIPLTEAESITLDFGAVYTRLFESVRLLQRIVDYEQLPVNFERYRADDQARIRQLMAEIRDQFGQ